MTFPDIVIPEEVQVINNGIVSSSSNTFADILQNWPQILTAIGVIVVGWLCMFIIQWVIKKIAKRKVFTTIGNKIGFHHFLQRAKVTSSPHELLGNFLGGYVFTLFLLQAIQILGITTIAEFLDNMIYDFIPHLVVALLIVMFGFKFAHTAGALIESTLTFANENSARVLGHVATNIIILFSILAALLQLNIADDLVKILFTGVVAMLALAGGLAFGLGAKEMVKETLESMKNKR